MISNIILLCRRPKRTDPEPEPFNIEWYWKWQTATTYAERQIADTLMRVPKIKTTI